MARDEDRAVSIYLTLSVKVFPGEVIAKSWVWCEPALDVFNHSSCTFAISICGYIQVLVAGNQLERFDITATLSQETRTKISYTDNRIVLQE